MRRMSNEYRKEKKSKYKICTQNADVVVRSVQSAMIPLVVLVTVSGILFGEIVLKKIKQIKEKLRHAEDEECDDLLLPLVIPELIFQDRRKRPFAL